LYDGNDVIDNVTNLGYLLGDEGSGTHLGKKLIRAYFYRELPEDLITAFEVFYPDGKTGILDHLYEGPSPNTFLAKFSPFLSKHYKHPFVEELVGRSFEEFLRRHVFKYEGYQELPTSFVGSIAYHFRHILFQKMDELGLQAGIYRTKTDQKNYWSSISLTSSNISNGRATLLFKLTQCNMEKVIKRIAVFTSGGDAPGMNAAVRAVVRTGSFHDLHMYGIHGGYEGMIDGKISRLERRDVGNIIHRGGTILKTARSLRFMEEEGRRSAYESLVAHDIDGLIAIGGNGTFTELIFLEKNIQTFQSLEFRELLTMISMEPTLPLALIRQSIRPSKQWTAFAILPIRITGFS
jgi:hypothetical protein